MRFPLHGVEPPLPSILPHEPPVIPPPLPPRSVFRGPTFLRYIRLLDFDTPSTMAPPDCGSTDHLGDLEFLDLQSACVRKYVDQRRMRECSVVEILGLQLVRDPRCVYYRAVLIDFLSFSDSFFNDVSICFPISRENLMRLSVRSI